MNTGTILDPRTGRPDGASTEELELVQARERISQLKRQIDAEKRAGLGGPPVTNFERGWTGGTVRGGPIPDLSVLSGDAQDMLAMRFGDDGPFGRSEESIYRELRRLPDYIKANLEAGKSWRDRGTQPPVADHSMYEVLRYWIIADTSVTAAAETIMVPAFNFGPSEMQVGTCLKMTLVGSQSEAATPGTFIYRMRWGGVAGALQVTSSTLTPSNSATATTNGFILEYWMTVRSIGATGTMWTQGRIESPSLLLAAATGTQISTYLLNCQIPATGAAVGAPTDFTQANGPSPTYQPSLGTANETTHMAFLECMD